MNRFVYILMLALVALSAMAKEPSTVDVTVGGIHYVLGEEYTATVGRCKGLSGEVDIPASIVVQGVPFDVVAIEDKAFAGCSELTSVRIPSSVELVHRSAFEGTSIMDDRSVWTNDGMLIIDSCLIAVKPKTAKGIFVVPERVRVVASGAFDGCAKMRELILPDGLRYIPPKAFTNCTALRRITIPASVERIGPHAFFSTALYANQSNWQDGLLYVEDCVVDAVFKQMPASLVMHDSVRLMADQLFKANRRLSSVVLPTSLSAISRQAFADCTGLHKAEIGPAVERIAAQAFLGCNALETADLPSSLRTIASGAFCNCYSLRKAILPEGLRYVPEAAYYHCYALDSLVLPSTLEVIDDGAFNGCQSLTSVVMPVALFYLGRGAFFSCFNLVEVDMATCMHLETIQAYAFKRCPNLASLALPLALKRIDEEAFADCPNLHLALPTSVSCHPKAF